MRKQISSLFYNMDNVYKKINASYAKEKNITGNGQVIAIMDTGIYPHMDLSGRIINFVDIVNKKIGMYDDNSHGTHVAGILAGNGKMSSGRYMGIAPKAEIIMLKVLDSKGNGETESVIRGFEWIKKNQKKYDIKIVNISVGTLPQTDSAEKSILVKGVEELWSLGITVIAAAGNAGPNPNTITTPGTSKKIITVGACDDMITDPSGKTRLNYSGQGPTDECVCKPDVVAPGFNITSCNSMNRRNLKPYSIKSGTSMSTPIVSGAVALMCEKYPNISNLEIKLRLRETCDDLKMPKNKQGWGLINIKNMLKD